MEAKQKKQKKKTPGESTLTTNKETALKCSNIGVYSMHLIEVMTELFDNSFHKANSPVYFLAYS